MNGTVLPAALSGQDERHRQGNVTAEALVLALACLYALTGALQAAGRWCPVLSGLSQAAACNVGIIAVLRVVDAETIECFQGPTQACVLFGAVLLHHAFLGVAAARGEQSWSCPELVLSATARGLFALQVLLALPLLRCAALAHETSGALPAFLVGSAAAASGAAGTGAVTRLRQALPASCTDFLAMPLWQLPAILLTVTLLPVVAAGWALGQVWVCCLAVAWAAWRALLAARKNGGNAPVAEHMPLDEKAGAGFLGLGFCRRGMGRMVAAFWRDMAAPLLQLSSLCLAHSTVAAAYLVAVGHPLALRSALCVVFFCATFCFWSAPEALRALELPQRQARDRVFGAGLEDIEEGPVLEMPLMQAPALTEKEAKWGLPAADLEEYGPSWTEYRRQMTQLDLRWIAKQADLEAAAVHRSMPRQALLVIEAGDVRRAPRNDSDSLARVALGSVAVVEGGAPARKGSFEAEWTRIVRPVEGWLPARSLQREESAFRVADRLTELRDLCAELEGAAAEAAAAERRADAVAGELRREQEEVAELRRRLQGFAGQQRASLEVERASMPPAAAAPSWQHACAGSAELAAERLPPAPAEMQLPADSARRSTESAEGAEEREQLEEVVFQSEELHTEGREEVRAVAAADTKQPTEVQPAEEPNGLHEDAQVDELEAQSEEPVAPSTMAIGGDALAGELSEDDAESDGACSYASAASVSGREEQKEDLSSSATPACD